MNKKDKSASETRNTQISVCDNSRQDFIKEVMKMPGGEKILDCIQCGSCSGGCPSMFAMDHSPMQIIKMINLGMKEEVLSSSTIWVCSLCYTCSTRCPRNVDFPTLMMSLRNKIIQENLIKDGIKSDFHKYFFESVNKNGRLNEIEVIIKLIDIKNFGSLLRNVRLGLRYLKRGKIRLRASKIETSWFNSLLEKTDQKEIQ
jgi:heterodisulfide reductase subunit C